MSCQRISRVLVRILAEEEREKEEGLEVAVGWEESCEVRFGKKERRVCVTLDRKLNIFQSKSG